MNIPNILTVIRFILIPFFGYCLYEKYFLFAIIIFIVAGITDVLDGYIARKYNLVTSFGKLADPLADKLMQITGLVTLTVMELIPPVLMIVVVSKEFFMALGSILIYKKQNFVVSANWYGKLATVIFFIAIVFIIVLELYDIPSKAIYSNIAVGIAVGFTLFAFLMYAITYANINSKN